MTDKAKSLIGRLFVIGLYFFLTREAIAQETYINPYIPLYHERFSELTEKPIEGGGGHLPLELEPIFIERIPTIKLLTQGAI